MVSDDRSAGLFIPVQGFGTGQHMKSVVPVAVAVEELDAGTLEALEVARMDPQYDALNALMDGHLID